MIRAGSGAGSQHLGTVSHDTALNDEVLTRHGFSEWSLKSTYRSSTKPDRARTHVTLTTCLGPVVMRCRSYVASGSWPDARLVKTAPLSRATGIVSARRLRDAMALQGLNPELARALQRCGPCKTIERTLSGEVLPAFGAIKSGWRTLGMPICGLDPRSGRARRARDRLSEALASAGRCHILRGGSKTLGTALTAGGGLLFVRAGGRVSIVRSAP